MEKYSFEDVKKLYIEIEEDKGKDAYKFTNI